MEKNIQIEMTFEKPTNRFRDNMENGVFTILFEVASPLKTDDLSVATHYLKAMKDAVFKDTSIETGLAFTDNALNQETWNPADFANDLEPAEKSRSIIFMSGKKSKPDLIADKINRCKSSGFLNIVAVTGDCATATGKTRPKNFDSVHILNQIAENEDKSLNTGCVVNPYLYTASAVYPQYYKLVKKIRKGANFVVAQSGWDLIKLQELRWFLESRELHLPMISRVALLTPEMAQEIISGGRPGIYISHDLEVILRKESQYGFAQFASAQWRRIQIQAAGARLMGCTGIMISGLERPEHIQTVCKKIHESFQELNNFDDWKNAYINYLSRAEMAPYKRFYFFENLFLRQHPEVKFARPVKECECSSREKSNYRICRMLFKNANMKFAGEHYLAKKIFAGCKGCSYCRIPLMQFVCPELCPKGISNGPCGGIKVDGKCEVSDLECIHSKRFRLALWKNELDSLEDRYIRPAT